MFGGQCCAFVLVMALGRCHSQSFQLGPRQSWTYGAGVLPISGHPTGVWCPLRCLGIQPGLDLGTKGCVLITCSGPAGMSLPPVGILKDLGTYMWSANRERGSLSASPGPDTGAVRKLGNCG